MELDQVSAEFTKQLEAVAKGITDKVAGLDEKLDSVHKKTSELETKVSQSKTKKEDDDPFATLDDDDEDETPEKMEARITQNVRSTIQNDSQYQRECASWDTQAFQKFPQLNDRASEFTKAVEKELEKAYPIGTKDGKKILSPDAVYNSASRIAADWALQGKLPIQSHEELEGGFSNRRIKGKDLGEVENDIIDYYKSYGINTDRARQRMKDNLNAKK